MHTNRIDTRDPMLPERRRFLCSTVAAAAVSACADAAPFVNERDESAGWTTHSRTIFGKTVTFALPPGGVLNPAPGADPFKFGDGSFGAVSYGQRPQGREVAALRVSFELHRYAPSRSLPIKTLDELSTRLNSNINDFLRLRRTATLESQNGKWGFQELVSRDSNLVWGEVYFVPLDALRYASVYSLLWPTYAKEPTNVARAHDILERMYKSVSVVDATANPRASETSPPK